MNHFLLILCLCCNIGLLSAQKSTIKPLPNGKVKDPNGKMVDLASYTQAGKISIVSFWATWCGPCKRELDAYRSHYADWQKKYGAQLLAVSIDDIRGQAKIKPMVAEKKWPYTILIDANNDMQRQLGFNSIPQLYLVDKKGNIVYQAAGYMAGSEKELEAKMATLN
jgi:cytochrome c biogenesis protein CcmG, thiol:disulfide interchange protein DsbE